jgi:hypothetical protein
MGHHVEKGNLSYAQLLSYGLHNLKSRQVKGIFQLPRSLQTGSGAHPASCSTGADGNFHVSNSDEAWSWPRRSSEWVNHTSTTSTRLLRVYRHNLTSTAYALRMQASGTFTFRHWLKNIRAWKNKLKVAAAFFMEAIPLCLLLNRPQLFSLTRVYFNSTGYPYMHATYCGLYLGHPQACQYKNLTNEDTIRI